MASSTLLLLSIGCFGSLAVLVAALGYRYQRLIERLAQAAGAPAGAVAGPGPGPIPAVPASPEGGWESEFKKVETMSLRADPAASQQLDGAVEAADADRSAEWLQKNEAVIARLRSHLGGHASSGGRKRLRSATGTVVPSVPGPAVRPSVARLLEAPVPASPIQAAAAVAATEGHDRPAAAAPAAPAAALQRKPSLRVKHKSWADKLKHDSAQAAAEGAVDGPSSAPAEPPAQG